MIVDTDQVCGSAVDQRVIRFRVVVGGYDRARIIQVADDGTKIFHDGIGLFDFPRRMCPLVGNFIAHTPDDNAGMIPVAQHLVAQVAFVPLVEILRIIVFDFRKIPHVESFVHHQKPHAVGQIQELRIWRIVGGAQRIAAHVFQQLKAVFQHAFVECRAQAPQVVMVAGAQDFQMFPVEKEAFFRIKMKITQAHVRAFPVLQLAVYHQRRHQFVQIRIVRRPQMRVFHLQRSISPPAFYRKYRLCHQLPGGIKQLRLDRGICTGMKHRLELRFYGRRGLTHIGRGNISAPVRKMIGIDVHQPHITVDPRTGIPAGIGLLRIVHPDGDHIGLVPVQVRGQIILERDVAVGTEAQQMAVDPYFAVAIHPIEIDKYLFAF